MFLPARRDTDLVRRAMIIEVRGVDDQRVARPMPYGVIRGKAYVRVVNGLD